MRSEGVRAQHNFLSGGGEMGARIRQFDWSSTAIGSPESWSPALRTLVHVLLANRFPLLLWWGPEYISIYNDAYSPILGRKHPWGLGRPVRECWSEIWDVLKPLIDTPFTGGPATWIEDIELQINRAGFSEETHFTVAYSPVPDETTEAGIGGVLATVHEITDKVIGERRGAILRELGSRGGEPKTVEEACETAARTLGKYPKDIPFALIYLVNSFDRTALLAGSCGVEETPELAPVVVDLEEGTRHAGWPLPTVDRTERTQVVTNLGDIFPHLPPGTWPEPPHTAVVVPIRSNIAHQLAGYLVLGLSSHLKLDQPYENFLELAASQVSAALANARAYEAERSRAEALAEIDRAKTAFFSNVSHEFRTPLTLMLGPLESVLATRDVLSEEHRQQLETAHRNSLRLLKLVNSLLDFSRIEAGRLKAAYMPLDLAALTVDLSSNFSSAMKAAGLDFIVDCSPLPEPVFVDREMWEKIVLNLLSNAFKFTFEGSVRVTLELRDSRVVLTVADTGVGIPESEMPHIFKRFHRVEGARGRTYEGTGIGLALVQELVKLHGGSVEVASIIGEGSTFTVTIPLGHAHLPQERIGTLGANDVSTNVGVEAFTNEAETWIAREGLNRPFREVAGRRPKILLADDNADMREYVCNLLGPNYDVVAVSDGNAALEQAKQTPPNLVLSDVMMPGLDGFGLLAEMRSDPRLREIPIILLSARAGEEARTEGIAAGADAYLTKPFSARELFARVQTTLDLQRVRRQERENVEDAREAVEALNAQLTFDLTAMARMQQLSTRLVQAGELNSLLGEILDGAIEITRADKGNIQLIENGVLRIAQQRGFDDSFVEYFNSTGREQAACDVALQCKERVIVEDVAISPLFAGTPARDVMLAAQALAVQSTPLISRSGRTLGMLSTHYSSPRRPAERDIRMLDVLARQAADVIERNLNDQKLKASEEELRLANWDLELFAHSASHDLQEPLRTVKIYSELVEQRYRNRMDEQGLEFLDFIRNGATRMETLVRDLLTYTRVTRLDKTSAVASSTDCLKAVLANLAGIIAETQTEVIVDWLPPVQVHSAHLQQLFQNLIGNAIKYRREGVNPVVHINAERQTGSWQFSVADNGIGIEPRFKERIFGLFKRLHTSEEYSGSGIGLAICQRIVEQYHGRIWVESRPGQGATFIFTIPD